MGNKIDITECFSDPHTVAIRIPAADLFGILRRSLDLPTDWAALVIKESGDHTVVSAGGTVSGSDAEEIVFVRSSILELQFDEFSLPTSDKFDCTSEVRLRAGFVLERSDLLSLRNGLLSETEILRKSDILRHFSASARKSLICETESRTVETLVDGDESTVIGRAIENSLESLCFSAGMTLDSPIVVSFSSSGFERVRKSQAEVAQRRGQYQASQELQAALRAARDHRLSQAAGTIERLKELADASPDADLADLIKSCPSEQRSELYEALLSTQPVTDRVKSVVVATGGEILFYDVDHLADPKRRVTLDGLAGGVRSVQVIDGSDGEAAIYCGSATGVYRLPVSGSVSDLTCRVVDAPAVRGGFNSVACAADKIIGSHSELGICEWSSAEPDKARRLFTSLTSSARAVRGVVAHDEFFYCAIDSKVIRWPANGDVSNEADGNAIDGEYAGSDATVTAICPTPKGLLAGTSHGDLLHWLPGSFDRPNRLHSGGGRPIESISWLTSFGLGRVVFADTSIFAHVLVLGDNFTGKFEAGGQTIRRIEAAENLLVGTNDVLDRIICWKPGQPNAPIASTIVAQLTGHSIQDVCLLGE